MPLCKEFSKQLRCWLRTNTELFLVWLFTGYYGNLKTYFTSTSFRQFYFSKKKKLSGSYFFIYYFFWHRCRRDRHGHHVQVFAMVVVFTVFHRFVVVFVVVVGSMSSWSLCSLALCRCICPV